MPEFSSEDFDAYAIAVIPVGGSTGVIRRVTWNKPPTPMDLFFTATDGVEVLGSRRLKFISTPGSGSGRRWPLELVPLDEQSAPVSVTSYGTAEGELVLTLVDLHGSLALIAESTFSFDMCERWGAGGLGYSQAWTEGPSRWPAPTIAKMFGFQQKDAESEAERKGTTLARGDRLVFAPVDEVTQFSMGRRGGGVPAQISTFLIAPGALGSDNPLRLDEDPYRTSHFVFASSRFQGAWEESFADIAFPESVAESSDPVQFIWGPARACIEETMEARLASAGEFGDYIRRIYALAAVRTAQEDERAFAAEAFQMWEKALTIVIQTGTMTQDEELARQQSAAEDTQIQMAELLLRDQRPDTAGRAATLEGALQIYADVSGSDVPRALLWAPAREPAGVLQETRDILAQWAQVAGVRLGRQSAQRAQRTERLARMASAMLGLVALLGLTAAFAAVPDTGAVFTPWIRAGALTLLLLAVVGVMAWALTTAHAVALSARQRTAVRVFAVATLVVGLALALGIFAFWYESSWAIAVAAAFLFGGVLLWVLGRDSDESASTTTR